MATGAQTVLRAEGESVTLGCRYTPSPLDAGELDIEWSVINPDTTQKDHMVRGRRGERESDNTLTGEKTFPKLTIDG